MKHALALCLLTASAQAEPVRLRMAAMAPAGTSWARELHNFAAQVKQRTSGEVEIKWFLGGIVGDEFEMLDRIRRKQLDGGAGALVCEKLAPSLQAIHAPEVVMTRAEANRVLSLLRPRLRKEFAKSGFVDLGVTTFGTILFFTRDRIESMEQLRQQKFWLWNRGEVWMHVFQKLGLHGLPMTVPEAGPAFVEKRVDGFFATPSAALAYQWSGLARFVMDLGGAGQLPACIVISQASLDALPIPQQQILREAGAHLEARFGAETAAVEDALLGGLFQKQGVTRVVPSVSFRGAYADAARKVRDTLPPAMIDPKLIREVLGWLADFRGSQESH